ncbi:pilus assembly protein N-terminal domain-containing protein [Novosphingobium resinovorum]|uniref:Flp pilus assembly protein, secretin CpaC n=1 Tax=Novosphingobium resinovorum TaxID=158500 RepID=A0A031JPF5_9SPHN|nr:MULTISPECIES: pilus assembly protein N-terminal domain-containing protein [Novosphingobium]AOR79264.1 pilus assembly protein CpaC [Novosphingobium resinovorum]EZP79666.1 Flp pilus assembly protein, secretin CpaC precursor [Novosphingobium resinovorum]MBF7014103.1 pilus assembly protein N-terminal domain-containing protein [Novosphingobium sp. HR1a]WJM26244.1 pilus assembly protein N-terminal domain-containing protein [Novosphingobium resinovorum]
MKPPYSTALLACVAVLAPGVAHAQDQRTLQVDEAETLRFTRSIARIEVNRDNVIAVSAPTSQSLRVSGQGAGEATLAVYAADGSIIGQTQFHVDPPAPTYATANGPLRAGEKVVAVDVQFAAVSSSTLKALGFSFAKLSGDIQGALVPSSSLNGYSFNGSGSGGTSTPGLNIDASAPIQSAFNLFLSSRNRGIGAVLSALSSNGLSQLLAQPTLLVRSGEKASFLAGGEFPVPVPQSTGGNGNTISIQYKEFGVRLSVTPYVLNENSIVLKLAPEVSELDYNNGVQLQGYTVPGIRRRSTETTVELGSGQSFVIAGLNYSNSSVTKDKVPFLGDLPVLGAFFKRQQNQKERQELIIVATPRLVEPEAVKPMLATANKSVDPTIGQMIVGNDGVEQGIRTFGVVRR